MDTKNIEENLAKKNQHSVGVLPSNGGAPLSVPLGLARGRVLKETFDCDLDDLVEMAAASSKGLAQKGGARKYEWSVVERVREFVAISQCHQVTRREYARWKYGLVDPKTISMMPKGLSMDRFDTAYHMMNFMEEMSTRLKAKYILKGGDSGYVAHNKALAEGEISMFYPTRQIEMPFAEWDRLRDAYIKLPIFLNVKTPKSKHPFSINDVDMDVFARHDNEMYAVVNMLHHAFYSYTGSSPGKPLEDYALAELMDGCMFSKPFVSKFLTEFQEGQADTPYDVESFRKKSVRFLDANDLLVRCAVLLAKLCEHMITQIGYPSFPYQHVDGVDGFKLRAYNWLYAARRLSRVFKRFINPVLLQYMSRFHPYHIPDSMVIYCDILHLRFTRREREEFVSSIEITGKFLKSEEVVKVRDPETGRALFKMSGRYDTVRKYVYTTKKVYECTKKGYFRTYPKQQLRAESYRYFTDYRNWMKMSHEPDLSVKQYTTGTQKVVKHEDDSAVDKKEMDLLLFRELCEVSEVDANGMELWLLDAKAIGKPPELQKAIQIQEFLSLEDDMDMLFDGYEYCVRVQKSQEVFKGE